MNTARTTRVVAISAPVTSSIACRAASLESNPFSSMFREVFSTTTMASSTTIPIARIRPKSVSMFSEKPAASSTANVASSDTGMVIVGTRVARKFCMNR